MKILIILLLLATLLSCPVFAGGDEYGVLILPAVKVSYVPVLDKFGEISDVSKEVCNINDVNLELLKAANEYKVTGQYTQLIDPNTAPQYVKDKVLYSVYVIPWGRFSIKPVSWIYVKGNWQEAISKLGYKPVVVPQ